MNSPLKKDYIKQIHHDKTHFFRNNNQKKNNHLQKPQKQNSNFEIFNNCIKIKLKPNGNSSTQKNNKDFFEILFFSTGIFNINKIHKSNISQGYQKKNLRKNCIPIQQRIVKSLYFLPTQTIIQTQYDLQNRLHKQAIFYCPGTYLIIYNFKNGQLDQYQYNFNLKQKTLIKSKYYKGKLTFVQDYYLKALTTRDQNKKYEQEQVFQINLQRFLKDKQLCKEIYDLIQGYFGWLQEIQVRTQTSSYYGQFDYYNNIPNGYGILINRAFQQIIHSQKNKNNSSQKSVSQFRLTLNQTQIQKDNGYQIFYGNFASGLLDGIGSIWFKDKSTYYGQFYKGDFIDMGQYYKAQINEDQSQSMGFKYKQGNQNIEKGQFIQELEYRYFYGKLELKNRQNSDFVHNQYQKLKKIYSSTRQFNNYRNDRLLQQQTKRKVSYIQSQKSGSFQQTGSNKKSKKQKNANQSFEHMQDITFSKQSDVRDMFQKIKIQNANNNQTYNNKNLKRQNTRNSYTNEVRQKEIQKFIRNTSRSDEHKYDYEQINNKLHNKSQMNNKNKNKSSYQKQDPKNRGNSPPGYPNQKTNTRQKDKNNQSHMNSSIKRIRQEINNKFNPIRQQLQEPNSYSRNRIIRIDEQQIDLGAQQISFSPKNRQGKFFQQDYIQKQYNFQQPKKFRTPQYFITQYFNDNPRYNDNKRTLESRKKSLKKNQYHKQQQHRPQLYLFPQKDSQTDQNFTPKSQVKQNKYEKVINKGKVRRIFNQESNKSNNRFNFN